MDFAAQNPLPSPVRSMAAKSPVLPWKIRLLLSLSSLTFYLTVRSNGTVNRRLRSLCELKSAANPVEPIDGVISFDITVDSTRNLSIRVFSPVAAAAADSLPIIIYFHGGGFALFTNASLPYVPFCRRLARGIPAVILSVDYRLSPEHRFPSQLDDGFDILRFLDDNTTGLLPAAAADLSHCFLAGDSSGANLAHHVAIRFCRQKSQFQRLNIIGLLSVQPFLGGIERTESEIELDPGFILTIAKMDWMWRAFLPVGSDRDHYAANVTVEEISDLEDFPATIVVIGGFDLLKDRQRKYYKWLKECGMKVDLIEFPNMIHAFYLFPELPESFFMINHLKEFVFKCREI